MAVAGDFRLRIGGEAIPEIPHAGSILSGSGARAVETGDWAVTRASERLTLSYPQCDARGQHNLPSVYLDGVAAVRSDWQSVLPQPGRQRSAARPPAIISSADLLEVLAQRHQSFGPRSLETYLQCPFQFFGRDTLHLHPAPARPEKRFQDSEERNGKKSNRGCPLLMRAQPRARC